MAEARDFTQYTNSLCHFLGVFGYDDHSLACDQRARGHLRCGAAMQVAISAALIGIALSCFFKVQSLFPAFAVNAALLLGAGIANGQSVSSILLMLVVAAVGLQLGYVVGMAIQNVWRAAVSHFDKRLSDIRRQRRHGSIERAGRSNNVARANHLRRSHRIGP
jgi:hypothetical protein